MDIEALETEAWGTVMKIVMVADDSPVIRKVARRLLEDMNFVVVEASDGEEVVRLAGDNMPDAILIDWDMPRMNGQEVIEAVKAMPEAAKTKLIYCTSEVLVPEMTKAKRSGAHGFLMKPFNRKVLMRVFIENGLLDDSQQQVA